MTFLRRLIRLPSLALLAVEAAVALTVASVRIGRTSQPRLVQLLGDPLPADTTRVEVGSLDEGQRAEIGRARRIGRVVTRVARVLPWRPTCLRQSLATQRMLARRRVIGTMHLGVADVASMDAHAWVTVHGWTVVGQQARRFTPVASFLPAR
jgi:hypothetical protein